MDLVKLKGIGPKRVEGFHKLGIVCVEDLLYYGPTGYEDRKTLCLLTSIPSGRSGFMQLTVTSEPRLVPIRGKKPYLECQVADKSGTARLIFFHMPWLKQTLKVGSTWYVYGKVQRFRGNLRIVNPSFGESVGMEFGRIVPLYPATKTISQLLLRSAIAEALRLVDPDELLPHEIRMKYHLPDIKTTLRFLHVPQTLQEADIAKKTMAYTEAFLFAVRTQGKQDMKRVSTAIIAKDTSQERDFLRGLPFLLTEGQKCAMRSIKSDLESGQPMNRLLQGDVGSGKTVVAQYAAMKMMASGYQIAFMSPTAILAEQNYQKLDAFAHSFGFHIRLLTAGATAAARREILEGVRTGAVDGVVGTHSLLHEGVDFPRLGLAIIDEQHRFGVRERDLLLGKQSDAHLLVMSATPIPRTLALIIHGELDVSEIRDVPSGRTPIRTYVVPLQQIDRVWSFTLSEIQKGRQAYVVCPLIEENEVLDLKSATQLYENLKESFPSVEVGLLTGRAHPEEKDRLMRDFRERKLAILVSTTVIEVGIDVPNATVMVIVNAERFGLSQLHQLRGRVGRGGHLSTCLLVSDAKNEDAYFRLKTMERTTSGFDIAEADLSQRGPGDFLGFRQHGKMGFRFLPEEDGLRLLWRAREDYLAYRLRAGTLELETLFQTAETYLGGMFSGRLN